MIHKRGRSGGPVFFLAKNPGLWHNGQERKVRPVTSLTKRAIRASFLKLLNERPLNKIPVKDIVEDCGINRNSFYYHYTDIPGCKYHKAMHPCCRLVQKFQTTHRPRWSCLRWYCAYEKPSQQKWRIARYHQLLQHDFPQSSCL